jgi:hypothetical protein
MTLAQAYEACVYGVIGHAVISGVTLVGLFWSRTTERRLSHLILKWDGLTTLAGDALIASVIVASQIVAFGVCVFSIWYATRPTDSALPSSVNALRAPALAAAAVGMTGFVLAACVLGI